MMSLRISEIVDATNGVLMSDEDASHRQVTGLVWDSRKVKSGNAFLAMPGERVDGNDYIVQAVRAGAAVIIATKKPSDSTRAIAGEFYCPIIVVDNGEKALTRLATYWRDRLRAVVIGVTGSSGKTSTKDLLRSVLSMKYKTVATEGNHNNEIGVPATILSAAEDTEVLIVEMGMRGLGQISEMCKMVRPSIGVITNIGVSHMEILGSQENIARAKAELIAALPNTGCAILNADDPFTQFMLDETGIVERGVSVRTYGFSQEATTIASDVVFDTTGCARFEMKCDEMPKQYVRLTMPGRHNVMNALAAAGVGRFMGMMPDTIAIGLEQSRSSAMRMEISQLDNGITAVNDAYNANPDSMKASLATMREMKCDGKRIAVLGDMGELGENEYELHVEVGKAAAQIELDALICVGALSHGIAEGARNEGMDASKITECETVEDAIAVLKGMAGAGDLVLVKASRFMGMERIVRGIAE